MIICQRETAVLITALLREGLELRYGELRQVCFAFSIESSWNYQYTAFFATNLANVTSLTYLKARLFSKINLFAVSNKVQANSKKIKRKKK